MSDERRRVGWMTALGLALFLGLSGSAVWANQSKDNDKEQDKDKAGQAESKKAESKPAPAKSSPYDQAVRRPAGKRTTAPKVYTNEDLLNSYGIADPSPTPTAPPAAAAPAGEGQPTKAAPAGGETPAERDPEPGTIEWLEKQQESELDRQQRVREAEAELRAAREHLASLEKQRLAVVNPYSARPKLSEEEKEARKGETPTVRLERTRELVEQARQRVQLAEQALAAARAGR